MEIEETKQAEQMPAENDVWRSRDDDKMAAGNGELAAEPNYPSKYTHQDYYWRGRGAKLAKLADRRHLVQYFCCMNCCCVWHEIRRLRSTDMSLLAGCGVHDIANKVDIKDI